MPARREDQSLGEVFDGQTVDAVFLRVVLRLVPQLTTDLFWQIPSWRTAVTRLRQEAIELPLMLPDGDAVAAIGRGEVTLPPGTDAVIALCRGCLDRTAAVVSEHRLPPKALDAAVRALAAAADLSTTPTQANWAEVYLRQWFQPPDAFHYSTAAPPVRLLPLDPRCPTLREVDPDQHAPLLESHADLAQRQRGRGRRWLDRARKAGEWLRRSRLLPLDRPGLRRPKVAPASVLEVYVTWVVQKRTLGLTNDEVIAAYYGNQAGQQAATDTARNLNHFIGDLERHLYGDVSRGGRPAGTRAQG